MTEAEWLAAADPGPMLDFLRGRGGATDRKLRLFAVACCRRVWHLFSDHPWSREAVGLAESLAERQVTEEQREVAWDSTFPDTELDVPEGGPHWYARLATHNTLAGGANRAAWLAASAAAHAVPDPAEPGAQAGLLRDLLGNPFRPAPPLALAVLSWNGGTVPRLAAAIYEERAFDRLPVLADALEDTGCTDADILGHCRAGGEHVRGCWVVDLVLGKE
jgi:hypothetical protein